MFSMSRFHKLGSYKDPCRSIEHLQAILPTFICLLSQIALHITVDTMGWLDFTSKFKKEKDDAKYSFPWSENLNATDWQHYKDPRTLIPTILLTTTILISTRFYRSYLKRIPEAAYIRPRFFRKRSLFGTVTRVGDADNFHLFHTPGGRLAGWGWLPGRRSLPEGKELKNMTVSTLLPYGFIRSIIHSMQTTNSIDSRSDRRSRRARGSSFWQTRSTFLGRSFGLAQRISTGSSSARLYLPTRSV